VSLSTNTDWRLNVSNGLILIFLLADIDDIRVNICLPRIKFWFVGDILCYKIINVFLRLSDVPAVVLFLFLDIF